MRASTRTRVGISSALCVLATLVLIGALVSGYAKVALFSSDGFSDRAAAALDDEAVRSEIAIRVTDDVVEANGDLIAVRPVIQTAVDGLVGSSLFQGLFRNAVRDVHRAFFDGDEDTVTLTLTDVGVVLRGVLQALQPDLAHDVKANLNAAVTPIKPPAALRDVARIADDLSPLPWILLVAGLLLAAAAVWVSRDRRRMLLVLGISMVVGGVAAAVAIGVLRTMVLAGIDEPGARDAARGIWDAFLRDLRNSLYVFAGFGAVVAAAASSLLRPVDLGAPVRAVWARVQVVPERTWARVLRALAFIAVGVLVIANRDAVIDFVVLAAGLYVVWAGVSELMRLTVAPADDARRGTEIVRGRRALVTAGITVAVILAAGAVFIGSGGVRERGLAIASVGCNGSHALCDRQLDQVAIPMTHNAMSAATNKDWLFAQQDAGFPQQLQDGIRGFAIDAHFGVHTESGKVKTDLSKVGSSERRAYAKEIGHQALNAALRIRDRIVSSPPTGPRRVYLCHRFCELGAFPIDRAFRDFRDFLAANPDEVIVIVIEDYVPPAAVEAAFTKTGLIDYVYKGSLDPSPTLQEMIDSGGRAVVMAENHARRADHRWYHPAYDKLFQETPYSFKRPAALIAKRHLAASCEPNRGPASAPYFLINHWVDTSPAPKPSNAAEVNAYKPLIRRIHECERIRDLTASLVSVDFYREGDLFKVVDTLNSERGG